MKQLIALMLLGLASLSQAAPKVAVTDLAYEERVREYIRVVSAQSQVQATGFSASASSSYDEIEGTYSYVERGELRKFTGDIKGEILKSRMFQLIQGKPYTAKENEGLYDVIARIRQGHFQGADYVLFGTLSDIDFRQDLNDIANTDSYSKVPGADAGGGLQPDQHPHLRDHVGIHGHGGSAGRQAGQWPGHPCHAQSRTRCARGLQSPG